MVVTDIPVPASHEASPPSNKHLARALGIKTPASAKGLYGQNNNMLSSLDPYSFSWHMDSAFFFIYPAENQCCVVFQIHIH